MSAPGVTAYRYGDLIVSINPAPEGADRFEFQAAKATKRDRHRYPPLPRELRRPVAEALGGKA